MGKETLRSEWVKCGKKCKGCPHGPYWYAYWREDGKLRKRYVGKGDPRTAGGRGGGADTPDPDGCTTAGPATPPEPHDNIFNDRLATLSLALDILGLPPGVGQADAKKRYRELSMRWHPDRNVGDPIADRICRRVNAAWSYLRAARGW